MWALFGLLLLTGATVLVIDEIAQYRARAVAAGAARTSRCSRLRRLKAVSDGYGLDVVDTTFRVRNNLITWDEGVAVVDARARDIDAHWRALAPMPRSPAAAGAVRADRAGARARRRAPWRRCARSCERRDIGALGRFADTELYPAVDPVTARLKRVGDLAWSTPNAWCAPTIERGRRAQRVAHRAVAAGAAGWRR